MLQPFYFDKLNDKYKEEITNSEKEHEIKIGEDFDDKENNAILSYDEESNNLYCKYNELDTFRLFHDWKRIS